VTLRERVKKRKQHHACQAFRTPLLFLFAPIVVFDLVRLFALVVFLLSRMSHRLSLLSWRSGSPAIFLLLCICGAVHPLSCVSVERLIRYHFVVVYLWSGSSASMCIRGAAYM
jgi:hypothetical protein